MKKADDWNSLLVRAIGYCEKCNTPGEFEQKSQAHTGGLENHHILEKSVYLMYRYLKTNCICICTKCHTEAENDKNGFRKWLEENRNDIFLWMIEAEKSKHCTQINYQKIAEQLEAQYKEFIESNWMDLEAMDVPPGRKI